MGSRAGELVVFVGPSLAREDVRRLLPRAQVEPPIARGDLDGLRRVYGATTFLVIDGAFAHKLAVSPSEIVAALRGGARIFGAASIGAVRAAECWPAGMEGIGAVYSLFRLGVIRDDDEVAVATDPDRDFAAVSVALVNVRFAALAGLRAGILTRADMRALLVAAKRAHFSERRWETIFASAGVPPPPALRELCEGVDVKRRDAVRAVEQVAGWAAGAARDAAAGRAPGGRPGRAPGAGPGRAPGAGPEARAPTSLPLAAPNAERYPGHDRQLGYPAATLRRELARWLLGSGRYRRHLPAGALADARGADEQLWSTLTRTGALEPELMRWYAIQRAGALDGAGAGGSSDGAGAGASLEGAGSGAGAGAGLDWALSDAERRLAAEHGFGSWSELVAAAGPSGMVAGLVPVAWVKDACRTLGLARHNLASRDRSPADARRAR